MLPRKSVSLRGDRSFAMEAESNGRRSDVKRAVPMELGAALATTKAELTTVSSEMTLENPASSLETLISNRHNLFDFSEFNSLAQPRRVRMR
jgi:hypothetical protein